MSDMEKLLETYFSRLIFLCFTLLCVPATSQDRQAPPPRPVVQAIDRNHDGILSAEEIARSTAALRTLDRNGDGKLDSLEFLAAQIDPEAKNPEELTKRLLALDANGDGVLSRSEVPERMRAMFDKADADHDGSLSAGEIRAAAEAQAPPRGRPDGLNAAMRFDPVLMTLIAGQTGLISAEAIAGAPRLLLTLDKNGDGQLSADEIRVRPMGPTDRAQHLMDEWDTNKDGRLSKAECPDRMQAQFATIDKDGDGFITEAEAIVFFTQGQGGGAPSKPTEGAR